MTVPLSLLCSGMIALALPLTGVQLVFLFLTPLAFALLMGGGRAADKPVSSQSDLDE